MPSAGAGGLGAEASEVPIARSISAFNWATLNGFRTKADTPNLERLSITSSVKKPETMITGSSMPSLRINSRMAEPSMVGIFRSSSRRSGFDDVIASIASVHTVATRGT